LIISSSFLLFSLLSKTHDKKKSPLALSGILLASSFWVPRPICHPIKDLHEHFFFFFFFFLYFLKGEWSRVGWEKVIVLFRLCLKKSDDLLDEVVIDNWNASEKYSFILHFAFDRSDCS
jgi:hypothetical protein